MTEIYKEINESETDSNNLNNLKWKDNSEISFRNYRIKFNGIDEPNYGRLVLNFKLFRNDSDITNEIANLGYCHPVQFPFSDTKTNFIFIPTENKIVLINTITNNVHKLDYPEPKGIRHSFFYDNYLILEFRKSYLIINLNNLKVDLIKEDNIDFTFPFESQLLVFSNNFSKIVIKSLETLSIIGTKEIDINSKKLFESTIDEYELKYSNSQKGYLWSTGHKNIRNSKKTFSIHKWNLVGFSLKDMTLDLGTTIPISNGKMDEKRTMWFDVENRYIRIKIKALVANIG